MIAVVPQDTICKLVETRSQAPTHTLSTGWIRQPDYLLSSLRVTHFLILRVRQGLPCNQVMSPAEAFEEEV